MPVHNKYGSNNLHLWQSMTKLQQQLKEKINLTIFQIDWNIKYINLSNPMSSWKTLQEESLMYERLAVCLNWNTK